MHYYVYILYSELLDLYYIGSAANPHTRLVKHLTNHKGFTAKAKDWKICFIEKHPDKTVALKREKQLKKWKSRVRIEALIAQQRLMHPD